MSQSPAQQTPMPIHTEGWQYDALGRVDWEDARTRNMAFPEMRLARKLVETEGFGLGGDVWGRMAGECNGQPLTSGIANMNVDVSVDNREEESTIRQREREGREILYGGIIIQ